MTSPTREGLDNMLVGGKERREAEQAEAVRQLTLSAACGLISAAPAALEIFLDQLGAGRTAIEAMERALACLEDDEDELSAEVVAAREQLADVRRFNELSKEGEEALDAVAELLGRLDSVRRTSNGS